MMEKSNQQPKFPPTGKIMVVDDEENILSAINKSLKKVGHKVELCGNGREALDAVAAEPPDVILLDLVMERISGLEVCRQIKNNSATAFIPVLMISGYSHREERLQAIDAGADDFLAKPLDLEEVNLRVRTTLQKKKLHDQLQEAFQQVKELEKTKENLINMLVHDLRSPLTGLMGYIELLKRSPELEEKDRRENLETAFSLAEIIMQMLQSLLDIGRLERNQMPLEPEKQDVTSIIKETLEMLKPESRRHKIIFTPDNQPATALCDKAVTRRICANLLMNALQISPENSTVEIGIEEKEKSYLISVKDQGPGLADEDIPRVFEIFNFGKNPKQSSKFSTGIGLTFCKLAAEAQGGEIGVESRQQEGSTFWFTLPK